VSTPRFSVVIPALNEEKLILNLLSVFTPALKNKYQIDVTLSDGGSSDSTLELSRHRVDRLIEHKEDFKQNISRGRNSGAMNSPGDVLIFLNADTFIPDADVFFKRVVEILRDGRVSAIACPVYVFPAEEKFFDKVFHAVYNLYIRLLNNLVMGMGRGECHIIRKDRFMKEGGYNEKFMAGEDFDLYRRIKRSGGKIFFAGDLKVYESPRRYRKYGYTRVLTAWIKNAFYILLFGRSASKEWEPVR
jgi:glycosyltransferase involved in cell wall biosynthesis